MHLDTLVIVGMPNQALVGIDAVSLVGRNFRGVKNLPRGTHFIWTSESERTMRCGLWVVTNGSGTVCVVQWDGYAEVFVEPSAAETTAQKEIYERNEITDLFDYESPPQQINGDVRAAIVEDGIWSSMSNCISPVVLSRVLGSQNNHWFCHTTDKVKGRTVNASEAALDSTLASSAMTATTEREISFTLGIDDRTYGTNLQGSERTTAAMDSTGYIIDKLSMLPNEADLIGELQLAFLLGMHLGSEGALEQWWFMVLKIFLRAHHLAAKRPRLTGLFLRTLAAQAEYDEKLLDGSIFEHAASNTQALRLAITVYGRRLQECLFEERATRNTAGGGVGNSSHERLPFVDAAGVLAAWQDLQKVFEKMGWDVTGNYVRSGPMMLEDGETVDMDVGDFEDEDERGDYAAVVVDVDENGRPRDLVSWD